VLTAPFVPMLFQGEEWAASTPFQFFTNHNPELGKLVSAGRRKEFAAFGWNPADIPDPQSPATFQRSKLNWDERRQPPHAAMLDWYRRLIALRRSTPDLTDPDLAHVRVRVRCSEDEQWLVMERGSVTVAFSLALKPIHLEVRPGSTIALASTPDIQLNNNALTLPPDAVAVLTSE
jgi:maltooligosyltrehalose trehalohydrolase